jgi:hypothetical protein
MKMYIVIYTPADEDIRDMKTYYGPFLHRAYVDDWLLKWSDEYRERMEVIVLQDPNR